MEPPSTSPESIRGEKSGVLGALRPLPAQASGKSFVLGQYRGYRSERGVAPESRTPTFAAMRVFIDNWRWYGVPLYLRAGKKLARKMTEVAIYFQRIPLALIGGAVDVCEIQPNVLVLGIQPDEGVSLRIASKVPGADMKVGAVTMDFRYRTAFGTELADAYQRILLDGMRGDQTLFARE